VVKKGFRHDLVPLAMSLVSVIFIVAIVAYDIYQHPADPRFVHSATIEISGKGHFQGDVGTPFNAYTVEGNVSQGSPFTIEVPYRRSDYISAYVRWADGSSGTTKLQVDCRTVDESEHHAVGWKVPRNWEGGVPPKDWSKCTDHR
jgi:hypothetical protein